MRLTNLTPHPIVIRAADGSDTVVAPSGVLPRVTTTPGAAETLPGIPCPVMGRATFGGVAPMPAPEDGVLFIVSGMVLAALGGSRPDVVAPGTGPNDGTIRDEAGRIVAVTRLIR